MSPQLLQHVGLLIVNTGYEPIDLRRRWDSPTRTTIHNNLTTSIALCF